MRNSMPPQICVCMCVCTRVCVLVCHVYVLYEECAPNMRNSMPPQICVCMCVYMCVCVRVCDVLGVHATYEHMRQMKCEEQHAVADLCVYVCVIMYVIYVCNWFKSVLVG